jgi:hypothetical protein
LKNNRRDKNNKIQWFNKNFYLIFCVIKL